MTQSLVRNPRHPPTSGSTLVRLLAAFDGAPVPATNEAFAERLSRWFEWREAIALSAALNAVPVQASTCVERGPEADMPADADVVQQARRVQLALARLCQEPGSAPGGRRRTPNPREEIAEPVADFASLRERYVSAQRTMAAQIASLRQCLRSALSEASPALAGLAALDAAMEQVVGEHEHVLLARVPRWLEPRFDRSDIAAFTRELQAVMHAELELRWQPIDALLDALMETSLEAVPAARHAVLPKSAPTLSPTPS